MDEMGAEEKAFRCSGCGETIAVNSPMQDALERHGCIVCGADVTADDFVGTSVH